MKTIRRIGVLTSGGDAPGMNAAIRAVVRVACYHELEVVGILDGYSGLINNNMIEMNARSVGETLQKGGTILYTARCPEFKEEAGVKKAVENAKAAGIDGMVVVGGDGSFRGARDLCRQGLPTIAVPGTIDNDISCSEYTVGFDTCLNTVMDAVDKLRDTCSSHARCSIVEVMGRDAGYIAINAAIACGAEVCLIPEKPFDFETDVLRPVLAGKARGKRHTIIIVAEGVKGVENLEKMIQEKTGIEARTTILGHIQRGGRPTVRDRVTASRMGGRAVELLLEGKSNRIVCMQDAKVVDVDIEEGLQMKKTISEELIELAKKLSV
ncbi:MAG: 6-phosphofructokinase [Ruminococcaceae bacterium]|nr:6-phosphofructokinase [Oscillospiraceae bacterium]